jgi:excisionase family DNA binding protein
MRMLRTAGTGGGVGTAGSPAASPLRSPGEVARYLAVSLPTLYRVLRSGRLRGTKVGGQWRISDDAVRQFLEDQIWVQK